MRYHWPSTIEPGWWRNISLSFGDILRWALLPLRALYEEFVRALRESGKEELREFVKKHTDGEIQPELVVQEGLDPDSILACAQAQNTDVIVMGRHGRRGSDRLLVVGQAVT
jgi:nucleotide-binding universal stress UspA family protein